MLEKPGCSVLGLRELISATEVLFFLPEVHAFPALNSFELLQRHLVLLIEKMMPRLKRKPSCFGDLVSALLICGLSLGESGEETGEESGMET